MNSANFKILDGKKEKKGYNVQVRIPELGDIWIQTSVTHSKKVACMRARCEAGNMFRKYMDFQRLSDEELQFFMELSDRVIIT